MHALDNAIVAHYCKVIELSSEGLKGGLFQLVVVVAKANCSPCMMYTVCSGNYHKLTMCHCCTLGVDVSLLHTWGWMSHSPTDCIVCIMLLTRVHITLYYNV